MNQLTALMTSVKKGAVDFARDEEGAQIVEYGLIIAVISVALIVALETLTGPGNPFNTFVTRVATCLTSTTPGSCV